MLEDEIVELKEDLSKSDLYSEDLAPVPANERTWNVWHLSALWVGMAVCIPTYLLSSYMIGGGMTWIESLVIIGLANIIVTIPMVLNGHAGVKYGIPFPVIGRASFGTNGIQIPSLIRAIVACGWFGVNAWIGGMAIYSIFNVLTGNQVGDGLTFGMFVSFGVFWLLNMYFIWKGTESIKFLEQYSAPILILMGLIMIGWGASQAGGISNVLKSSKQLENPAAKLIITESNTSLLLNPVRDKDGEIKAQEFKIDIGDVAGEWQSIVLDEIPVATQNAEEIKIQLRRKYENEYLTSSVVSPVLETNKKKSIGSKLWSYFFWLNIMVGFWGTMALSIADITRFAASQKDQIKGQFIGLPGTMMLYSFVGIFVTCSAAIIFKDILIVNDAPWDPIAFLAKFKNPWVVVVAQIFMIIATLSTNIAANVIAPSNAFSNLYPKKISFRTGGLITGLVGIIICPWWLMGSISNILILVSGFLGPILGVMLADYYMVRKKNLELSELYKRNGIYKYASGFNISAIIALLVGVVVAIAGYAVEALSAIYDVSWFSGFIVSFIVYSLLMKNHKSVNFIQTK